MKRRDLLRSAALSGICLGGFPLGFFPPLPQNTNQRTDKQRVLFFTRNVGFEHAVVRRTGNKLSFAEQQLTELLNGVGIEVDCQKDPLPVGESVPEAPWRVGANRECGRSEPAPRAATIDVLGISCRRRGDVAAASRK